MSPHKASKDAAMYNATASSVAQKTLQSHVSRKSPRFPVSQKTPQSPMSRKSPRFPVSKKTPQSPVSKKTPQSPVSKKTPQSPVSKKTPQSSVSQKTPQPPVSKKTPQSPVSKKTPQSPVSKKTPQSPVSKKTPQSPVSKKTPQSPVSKKTPEKTPQSLVLKKTAQVPVSKKSQSSMSKKTLQSPVSQKTPRLSAAKKTTSGAVPVKEGTQTELLGRSQTHPMVEFSEDPSVQNIVVYCNKCFRKTTGREVLKHLLFGNLKCMTCSSAITQCRDFPDQYLSTEKCHKGQHNFIAWEKPVWSFLLYCAERSWAISRFCENVNSNPKAGKHHSEILFYLKSLLPLKDILPWKTAFDDPMIKRTMEAENMDQNKPTAAPETQEKQTVELMNVKHKNPVENQRKITSAVQKDMSKMSNVTQKEEKEMQKTTPSSNSAAQPTLKTGSQDTEVQQKRTRTAKQDTTPLISLPAHIPTKSSPHKRRLVHEKHNQQNGTSMKHDGDENTPPVTRIEEEKGETKPIDTQKAAAEQTNIRSKPEETQIHQNRLRGINQNTNLSTSSQPAMKRKTELVEEKTSDLLSTKRPRTVENEANTRYKDMIPKKVLHSNNYLIIEFPHQECPEECANCYYSFSPEICSVNLHTFVINLVCPNCNLAVYIVPKMFHDKDKPV